MRERGISLAAIERIYRERGADFFRLALANTSDPETARDAVQDGFARAIVARQTYRGEGSVEAWVARCVINAARDARRRSEAHDRVNEPPPDAPASFLSALESDTATVRQAVKRLPARQRDALYLRFYLGFDYAAIAETLEVEVGTVSATLHAARASLAQTLEEVLR